MKKLHDDPLTNTSPVLQTGRPQKPENGGLCMSGTVRCLKCNKKRTSPICPHCGTTKCYIVLYWSGKQYKYFRSADDNVAFDYYRAERQLTLMRADIDRKAFKAEEWKYDNRKRLRFDYIVHDWLDAKQGEYEGGELKPSSVRLYRSYNRVHFKFFDGKDVREITTGDIEDFKNSLNKKLSLKMRKNIMWALHCFMRWLKRRGVIKEMPEFPVIKGNDARVMMALDYEEQQVGLKNIPVAHIDAITFGFETGLRPNETCALQVRDFDIPHKRALIQRGYSDSQLIETTKEGNKQWIPLTDTALEIAVRCIKGKFPGDFVFINPVTGRGYLPETLSNYWKVNSGMPISHYEASRHSFCTQIVEDCNANEFQAQLLMRHADPRSTRKYFHGNVDRLRDIVNKRGKVRRIDEKREEKKKEG